MWNFIRANNLILLLIPLAFLMNHTEAKAKIKYSYTVSYNLDDKDSTIKKIPLKNGVTQEKVGDSKTFLKKIPLDLPVRNIKIADTNWICTVSRIGGLTMQVMHLICSHEGTKKPLVKTSLACAEGQPSQHTGLDLEEENGIGNREGHISIECEVE